MKRLAIIFSFLIVVSGAYAQKFMTRTGFIGFFSHAPVEDIKADNNQVASVLDISTGEIVFQVLIRSFHFEKKLMEEHFNENYLESEEFPRSTFKGKILDHSKINFTKTGKNEVVVEGEIFLHNVTKKLTAPGIIEIVAGGINASSKFILRPEDFNITIPAVVRENIAKTIEVTVNLKYSPVESK